MHALAWHSVWKMPRAGPAPCHAAFMYNMQKRSLLWKASNAVSCRTLNGVSTIGAVLTACTAMQVYPFVARCIKGEIADAVAADKLRLQREMPNASPLRKLLKSRHAAVPTSEALCMPPHRHVLARRGYECRFECFTLQYQPPRAYAVRVRRMLGWVLWPAAVAASMWAAFGPAAAAAFVISSVGGVFFLSVINYIEHYGLARRELANGKFEAVSIGHSWNANHLARPCCHLVLL